MAVTREQLNTRLDEIDQAKEDRASKKAATTAAAASKEAAIAAFDQAAADYAASAQHIADLQVSFEADLMEYLTEPSDARPKPHPSSPPPAKPAVPTSRR